MGDQESKPAVPVGLGARGRKFWKAVTAEYELNVDESELLVEICRTLDEIEVMRAALATDGPVVEGSAGQLRPNPMLSQLRASRTTLSRLVAQLGLPDPEGKTVATGHQVRSRTAHTARWGARDELAGRRGTA